MLQLDQLQSEEDRARGLQLPSVPVGTQVLQSQTSQMMNTRTGDDSEMLAMSSQQSGIPLGNHTIASGGSFVSAPEPMDAQMADPTIQSHQSQQSSAVSHFPESIQGLPVPSQSNLGMHSVADNMSRQSLGSESVQAHSQQMHPQSHLQPQAAVQILQSDIHVSNSPAAHTPTPMATENGLLVTIPAAKFVTGAAQQPQQQVIGGGGEGEAASQAIRGGMSQSLQPHQQLLQQQHQSLQPHQSPHQHHQQQTLPQEQLPALQQQLAPQGIPAQQQQQQIPVAMPAISPSNQPGRIPTSNAPVAVPPPMQTSPGQTNPHQSVQVPPCQSVQISPEQPLQVRPLQTALNALQVENPTPNP